MRCKLVVLQTLFIGCLGFSTAVGESAEYKIIDGTSIPATLTGQPGDPTRGRDIAIAPKLGNCLACHQIPTLADQLFHGDIGPSLAGVAKRYTEGQLRLRLVNSIVIKPDSIMPAYYSSQSLYRVMPKFAGKTILTAEQVEDVVAFLLTLTGDEEATSADLVVVPQVKEIEIVSFKPAEGNPLNKVISGYYFQSAETRAVHDDDFLNPGFLWVDKGRELWHEPDGAAGRACASCHGDAERSMTGVGARYPVYYEPWGKLISLEQRINLCRTENMSAEAWAWGSGELVGMTTFVRHQSRGMPVGVTIDGPARPFFEKGREFFYKRRGLFNMSCSQCHDNDNYGRRLRGNLLSQAHTNAHPLYGLLRGDMLWPHWMFEHCNERVRSTPYPYGSDEYVNLELFMAWRGQGLPIETPGAR